MELSLATVDILGQGISACRARPERHEALVGLCLYSAGTRNVRSPTLLTGSS